MCIKHEKKKTRTQFAELDVSANEKELLVAENKVPAPECMSRG